MHDVVATKKKSRTKKISQPHDHLVKRLLSNIATAKDILNLYLPAEIIKLADLNYLELQRDSFIDDEHRVFEVDLLYKTRFQNEDGYFWILLEHQSTDDPWLPVRIFKYLGLVWDHLRKNSNKLSIPLVYPLIIYNGPKPYTSSLNFSDLIQPASSRALFDNFFNKPFHLVDLNNMEDDNLREHLQEKVRGVALSLTLKHIRNKNLQTIFEQTLLHALKILDQSGNRDDVSDMLYYLLNEGQFLNKEKVLNTLHEEFSPEVEDKVMTIAEQLKLEGFQRGIEVIAKRLLAEKADISFIANITGLPVTKLKEMQKSVH